MILNHHFRPDGGDALVHCDIKPGNILLDSEFEPKIADFDLLRYGKAGDATVDVSQTMMPKGTELYMAPEARHGEITVKLDVWAFGLIMVEIFSGQPPIDIARESQGLPRDLAGYFEFMLKEGAFELFCQNHGDTDEDIEALWKATDESQKEEYKVKAINNLLNDDFRGDNLETGKTLINVANGCLNRMRRRRFSMQQVLDCFDKFGLL